MLCRHYRSLTLPHGTMDWYVIVSFPGQTHYVFSDHDEIFAQNAQLDFFSVSNYSPNIPLK